MSDQIERCRHDRAPIPVAQCGKHLVVDIHCHLSVAAADALIRANMTNPPEAFLFSSPASDAVNGRLFAAIGPKLNGVDARIADMDALGVDVQAISPSPGQYYYFASPELGRDVSRLINDGVASAVAKYPDRLVGMGTLPLQQVELAIAEMRRCVDEHKDHAGAVAGHSCKRRGPDMFFRGLKSKFRVFFQRIFLPRLSLFVKGAYGHFSLVVNRRAGFFAKL